MNEQRKEWNPDGRYSDEPARCQRQKQTDSLTRFIDSCSPDIPGKEILDRVTGKYIPWKSGNRPTQSAERKTSDENIRYRVSDEQ